MAGVCPPKGNGGPTGGKNGIICVGLFFPILLLENNENTLDIISAEKEGERGTMKRSIVVSMEMMSKKECIGEVMEILFPHGD